jgi:hypothetical protein
MAMGGSPLRMAMESQRGNAGMNVPVFLIWGDLTKGQPESIFPID